MLSAATGHHELELTLAGQERQQRSHVMRGVLAGKWAELARSGTAAAYGIVADGRYVLALARGPAQATGRLESRLSVLATRTDIGLLSAEVDHDLAVLMAADAGTADDVLAEAGDGLLGEITVAVTDRAPVAELARSHEVARIVLQGAVSTERVGLVRLADVPLPAAILAQPEVGHVLGARYIEPLEAHGDFGLELLKTLRCWLDHGCRIDESADGPVRAPQHAAPPPSPHRGTARRRVSRQRSSASSCGGRWRRVRCSATGASPRTSSEASAILDPAEPIEGRPTATPRRA